MLVNAVNRSWLVRSVRLAHRRHCFAVTASVAFRTLFILPIRLGFRVGHLHPAVISPLLWRRRDVVVSGVRRMNEVNVRRAGLVAGWVTVFERVYHLGM